jgi:RND family efflux transporter MFP subunit
MNMPHETNTSAPDSSESMRKPGRRGLMAWIVISIVVILIAVGIFITVMHRIPAGKPEGSVGAQAVSVAVVSVTVGTITKEETFEGEFLPFDQIELRPQVSGFLKSITVDEGDAVQEHQLLAVLEVPTLDEDIARARATLARDHNLAAKNKTDFAQQHLTAERISGVAKQQAGLIAQQDIDEANEKDHAANGAWQASMSQVAVSKAELAKLLALQGYCQIKAPFSGVVTRRFADPGTLVQGGVSPGTQSPPLITLSRLDPLRLSFPVTESLVPRIHVGSTAQITVGALGLVLTGTVSRFQEHLEESTRTMEVQIDVPNPGLRITPGMFADVTMGIEVHKDVLTLPVQAVRRRRSADAVYALSADHHIEERTVTIGLESPDALEIVTGVVKGEQVVFGNPERVKPGQLVDPKPVAARPQGSP